MEVTGISNVEKYYLLKVKVCIMSWSLILIPGLLFPNEIHSLASYDEN